jgi:beta-lactamase regulating signal transducer with metallopeptidase domain
MQTFFAYHFLQSLAFSLLNSLWQMAFLWIIYNIITVLFSLKPVIHFRLLITFQAVGFLWFVYTFINSFYGYNSIYYESSLIVPNPFIKEKLLPLSAVIYLFFVFVFVAKFLIQFYNLNDIRSKELLPVSDKWQMFINNAKTSFNIAKHIQISISKNIATPLTIGFFKPIILIPIAAINQLSAQQLEAILLHELAHIKRNDYFLNLLLIFVDAFMFFNPFSKCIYTAINTQRELCCDDTVLQYNYPNCVYAEALLNVAKSQMQTQSLFGTMTAVTNNQQQLKQRIKRILNIEADYKNDFLFAKQMTFTFLFGALLFVLIGFINTNVKKIVTESIPVETSGLFVAQSVATNYHQAVVNAKKYVAKKKINSFTKKEKKENEVTTKVDYALLEKRAIIEQGFQQISKLATQGDVAFSTINNNEYLDVETPESNNNTTLLPAIETHPTTTVQKFFIPATAKSAASIIIVTTTEKDNGKKLVKIEIEKGDAKLE